MGALPRAAATGPRPGRPVPTRLASVPEPSGNPAPARGPGGHPPSTRSPAAPAWAGARHPASSTAPRTSPRAPAPPSCTAVDELGYVPNRAARSLVTRRTDTVALVVSESGDRLFGEPYFARDGARHRRAARGVPVPAAADDGRHRRATGSASRPTSPTSTSTASSSSRCTPTTTSRARLEARGVPDRGRRPARVRRRALRRRRREPGRRPPRRRPPPGPRPSTHRGLAGPQDMASGRDRLAGARDAVAEAGLDPSSPASSRPVTTARTAGRPR